MDETEEQPGSLTGIIAMRSGIYIDLLAASWPKGAFLLEDIAWNLSGVPRFGASASPELFVSDHCIDVALLAMDAYTGGRCCERASDFDAVFELGRQALMHDAEEAYVGDIPTPFGRALMVKDGAGNLLPFSAFKSRMRRAIFEDLAIEAPTQVAAEIIARCDLESLKHQALKSMARCVPLSWDCFRGVAEPGYERMLRLRDRHRTDPSQKRLSLTPMPTREGRYEEFLWFAGTLGIRG